MKDIFYAKDQIQITINNNDNTVFLHSKPSFYKAIYPFDKKPKLLRKDTEWISPWLIINSNSKYMIMQEGANAYLYEIENNHIQKIPSEKYALVGNWINEKEFTINSVNQIFKVNADNLETEKISDKGMLLFAINKWNKKVFLSKIPKID